MGKKTLHIILISCSVFLISCSHIFISKKTKYTKCCYFEPSLNKLYLSCTDKKINALRILVQGESNEFGKIIFEKRFVNPLSEIFIDRPADSIIHSRTIILYIWYQNYLMHDYSINIKPEDWIKNETLYAIYNYR